MKTETWRDHPDYPVIQVSDQGRVYRKPRTVIRGQDIYQLSGRIAAVNTGSKTGHLKVPIRMSGRYHYAWVHRLVLEAFVGPCPPGMETRHLNGNPKDNRLVNLAWERRLRTPRTPRITATFPLDGTSASVDTRSRPRTPTDHHADPESVIAGSARDNAIERPGSDDVPRDDEPERPGEFDGAPSPPVVPGGGLQQVPALDGRGAGH